ncbi:F-box/FBD/LRR-repeat protein At5g53840-like [Rutidosis leptorrhynchoides]|uniref:F-box/FBD/LRR-repeat protein At5g53840-like n=1 Tax=Rutidosis leptorrhynchoides TaxID=125765 RepID=UPI003A99DAD2
MWKRARTSRRKGDEEHGFNPNDYISRMPDDILVSILSKLSLKEAATTSNLSTKWRYLWCQTDCLDFDANDELDKIAVDSKLRVIERPKYINWVNRVTRQHKAHTIDEFRICFDFDKSSKCAIDKWVEFAISKRAQKLELDLLENGEMLRQTERNYVLPTKIFDKSVRLTSKRRSLTFPKTVFSKEIGIKFLKHLFLKCVNVSEEALLKLLVNCTALQQLSIHGSGDLVNVKISGKALVLKYLEIVFCFGVKLIEIIDSNLESFSYLGPGITIKLDDVPRLQEISIGEGYSGFENNVFGQISCCISHLQILTLDIYRPEEDVKFVCIPELPKLRQLILKIGAWDDDSLLEFTSLAKACPKLQRFVIQLIWMSPAKRRRKIRHAAKHPHQHLEMVEIVGYFGRTSDLELVVYFIENAIALKKLVIDPRYQVLERTPIGNDQLKNEKAARSCAKKQLEPRRPKGVDLVIL